MDAKKARGEPRLFEVRICRELLRDEIDDEDFVHDGDELFDEGVVGFVREVDIKAGAVLETDDEAMGVALSVVLGAHVGSPFDAGDGGDFLFQRSELFGDVGLLLVGGVLLKLDDDDMTVGSGFFFVMIGHGEDWEEEGKEDKN